ncbi:DEAD/DEAH box helicase, partial [Vibrio cholerae]|uniref:DEAD/DEAH box helicase n=1 Tax=Vibrio cholerae TaxID=666 RepID=UPI001F0AE206
DPRGLILVPTRELAKQVYGELRSMLGGLSYTATLITGGENFNDQVKGENALAFYSRYYQPIPLVLRGYGAGSEVTAAGVFSDVMRTLGWKL